MMNKRLCVVSRDRLDLFQELCHEFKDAPDVEVIFDRRIGDRRRNAPVRTVDNRRRSDRRHYRSEIRLLGWMLTKGREAAAIALAESQQV